MALTPKQNKILQSIRERIENARKYSTFEEYFAAELARPLDPQDRDVDVFKQKYLFHYRNFRNHWELNSKGYDDVTHSRSLEYLQSKGYIKIVVHGLYGVDRVQLLKPQPQEDRK